MLKSFFYFCVLMLSFILISACSIKKGYEALDEYNYFEAKKRFEKSLKKHESPAAYGLSIIYFRKDNPFHNLDSAYHYSLLAVESYNQAKEKKREKWQEKLSFTIEDSKIHREMLGDLNYDEAVKENTVDAFDFFMKKFPWSRHLKTAENKRDSLAFQTANNIATSEAYTYFLTKYGQNKWTEQAEELLEEAQYHETVIPGNTQSYMSFIQQFPDNHKVEEAQYEIYKIETQRNNVETYFAFIQGFPNSPYVNDAWTKLYRLFIADYKRETIEEFILKYPTFPFPELIERDLELVDETLLLYTKNGKYGFMNEVGNVKIQPFFEYADQFKNGLALVSKNGKIGYINKNGQLMIDYQFEEGYSFDQGRAVVMKDGMYGLIDVSGNFILPPEFEDIGTFVEGLAFVESKEGYQFYQLDGTLAFSEMFDEAFSFHNGLALVKKGNKSGYITQDGSFFIAVNEGTIRHFFDTLFIHELRNEANLLYPSGTYLYEEGFDQIGVLENNRAIVTKNNKYGYIDSSGAVVIPIQYSPFPNYSQFAQFSNNHAIYKQGDNFAMINQDGKRVLPALFKGIGKYGELIPITKGGKWGYTDDKVRLKIQYQYDYAHPFNEGIAIVELDGLHGVIDLDGNEVLPIEFESIKQLNHDLLLVKSPEGFALYSTKGVEMNEVRFSRLNEISSDLYQLIVGDEIKYYDVLNDRLITLQE